MSGSMMPPGMPPMGGQPPGMSGPPGMGPPPGGPMGAPQGGGMPQLPPQVIQMLMQALQQSGGGPGGPQGIQQPPQLPSPPIPQPGMQGMAGQGRNGDSLIAHMTPGEIAVPPQVQTPQLMAVLRAAFQQMGINPAQFTAGAPQASRNPATGAPEFSIWSSILPILGGVAGAALAPYTGGMSIPTMAALGGAAGGAAGGLVDNQSAAGVLAQAAGGGLGGYMGAPGAEAAGSAVSSVGAEAALNAAASNAAANGAAPAMQATMSSAPNVFSAGAQGASGTGQAGNFLQSSMPYIKTGLAAGTGAGVGGMLVPPPTTDPLDKAGFNRKLGPLNTNFNQVRGSGQTSTPNFTGYNPYATVAGPNPGFNFFPTQ